MTKRRNFSDKFKAGVALEALRGDKTVQEIAAKRQLHPTQVSTWKRQAIEGMASVFSDKVKKAENKGSWQLVSLTPVISESPAKPVVKKPVAPVNKSKKPKSKKKKIKKKGNK